MNHHSPPTSLVNIAVSKMDALSRQGNQNWLTNVRKIRESLSIPDLPSQWSSNSVSNRITKTIHSQFDVFYLNQINKQVVSEDDLDHNKLRFYKSFRGSFTQEPYLDLVHNRNQRSWLTRLRISAHQL